MKKIKYKDDGQDKLFKSLKIPKKLSIVWRNVLK